MTEMTIYSVQRAITQKVSKPDLQFSFSAEPLMVLRICVKFTSISQELITKTCLYNLDPLKPHFYIVKLGFTGVYIVFLISAQNIDYGYSLEPPRRGGSNEYPQSMF